MADTYTNALIAAGKKPLAMNGTGTELYYIEQKVAVLAADADGDIYRVFANTPSNYVPVKIEIYNTAVTGGTDYDLGLYDVNGGAVVDKDILADGISMATARTVATSNNAGMTTIDIANDPKTLGELSAETDVPPAYDIALTANTVGTADGTIVVRGWFATK